jgi:hypothetical protein
MNVFSQVQISHFLGTIPICDLFTDSLADVWMAYSWTPKTEAVQFSETSFIVCILLCVTVLTAKGKKKH